ncbi:hypothetical protein [Aureliella helgolandensis]|uniref:Phage virion morphogenesis family protein n=1 Tax=Aureliella helgolandensis TaxID=2527968 RepID=A0A518G4A9_9BACT|nr:hypothetical protein [Aureliella helgolandensis]QDV23428.1 hypothetical protein Q31a_17260 [Aureliella helgolandensis]
MAKSGFDINYSVKDFFFDRMKVQDKINRGERRQLSRIGSFVRRRARTSLRRRKKVSQSGSPPSVHSRDKVATLKNILFAYDATNHAVYIGPVRLNQVNQRPSGQSIPITSLHEFGGSVLIHEEQSKNAKNPSVWFRRDLRFTAREWKRYRTRRLSYPARPYMGTALAAEVAAGTIADVWAGFLSGAA